MATEIKPTKSMKRTPKKRRDTLEDADKKALEKLEAAAQVYAKIKEKQKRLERMVWCGSMLFVGGIIFSVWYTEGALIDGTVSLLQRMEGADAKASFNPSINCMHEKNKNTPYCQNRIQQQQSTWRGLTRFGGKDNAFTLHGRE